MKVNFLITFFTLKGTEYNLFVCDLRACELKSFPKIEIDIIGPHDFKTKFTDFLFKSIRIQYPLSQLIFFRFKYKSGFGLFLVKTFWDVIIVL